MAEAVTEWDAAAVRTWLEGRVAHARADQVAAERRGGDGRDDCDAAAAEEMVCSIMARGDLAVSQQAFVDALKALLDRDDFVWRGVYDGRRFDRHGRGYVRRLMRMAKANDGWGDLRRYQ